MVSEEEALLWLMEHGGPEHYSLAPFLTIVPRRVLAAHTEFKLRAWPRASTTASPSARFRVVVGRAIDRLIAIAEPNARTKREHSGTRLVALYVPEDVNTAKTYVCDLDNGGAETIAQAFDATLHGVPIAGENAGVLVHFNHTEFFRMVRTVPGFPP